MNVTYVNPFIIATTNLFKTMLKMDAVPTGLKIKTAPYPTYDVSGIIGLSGAAQGAIALSFPKAVALRIVSALVGNELKVIGKELTDGIGELANIVAGNAKQGLSQYDLQISLPRVIVGKNHQIAAQCSVPTIIVPFKTAMGDFAMEVTLKTDK